MRIVIGARVACIELHRHSGRSVVRKSVQAIGLLVALFAVGATGQPAGAETAWVKDEIKINIRSGPGTNYRIIATLSSGDQLEVLKRGEGWTQVKPGKGDAGWIPEGYLQTTQTAAIALAGQADEMTSLRERSEELEKRHAAMSDQSAELVDRDKAQAAEVARLTRENMAYAAGARWPEWITGAGILSIGMVVGWALKSSASNRRTSRIKL